MIFRFKVSKTFYMKIKAIFLLVAALKSIK